MGRALRESWRRGVRGVRPPEPVPESPRMSMVRSANSVATGQHSTHVFSAGWMRQH
jgi:hypothetical protein